MTELLGDRVVVCDIVGGTLDMYFPNLQPGLYVCMAAASKCVLGIEGIILWGGGRLGWRALQIGTCGMLGISGIWDGIMRERTEWLLAVSLMSQSHAAGRMN